MVYFSHSLTSVSLQPHQTIHCWLTDHYFYTLGLHVVWHHFLSSHCLIDTPILKMSNTVLLDHWTFLILYFESWKKSPWMQLFLPENMAQTTKGKKMNAFMLQPAVSNSVGLDRAKGNFSRCFLNKVCLSPPCYIFENFSTLIAKHGHCVKKITE